MSEFDSHKLYGGKLYSLEKKTKKLHIRGKTILSKNRVSVFINYLFLKRLSGKEIFAGLEETFSYQCPFFDHRRIGLNRIAEAKEQV